ncbi:MAG: sigma-70 family RNA polymerase sigma factor [Patescibacteria group bacterium]
MTTEDLIGEARGGNHAAFDQLYRSAYAPVYRFIYIRTRNKDIAEDLTQDVFTKMLQAHPVRPEGGSMLPYLFTVARNAVIDWSRKKKPLYDDEALMSVADGARSAEVEVGIDADITRMLDALQKLSEAEEAVLKLRYLDGLSTKEVAVLLGKSEEAVRQALSRGLKHLRSLLEGTDL